jgi:hypothetical protein
MFADILVKKIPVGILLYNHPPPEEIRIILITILTVKRHNPSSQDINGCLVFKLSKMWLYSVKGLPDDKKAVK